LRWPLFSISFVRFATAFAANGLVIATVSPYLVQLMEGDSRVFGVPIAALTLAGLIVGTRWFSDLALSVPLGHVSDRIGRHASISAGMSVMVAALLIGAGFAAVETVVVVLPVLFVASVLVNTTLDAAIGETAPDASRPAHLSRYSTYLDVGAALGPLLGFVVADRFGFRAGYLAAAVLLAVALAAYYGAVSSRAARRAAQ
jgi:MFS family permease